MSYDKRDYFIDGRRDLNETTSDDEGSGSPGPTSSVWGTSPQWWVATLLVTMKKYCEEQGVDLLSECSVDDLAALLSQHKSKKVYG